MARAVTRFWTPGVASDTLRPMLGKLLQLGQRFPETEAEPEQVPDSIYVMY